MSATNNRVDNTTLTDENRSNGGIARARNLTPSQRSAIASKAARTRWNTNYPKAEYNGTINVGGTSLSCAVLDNGTRLINQQTLLTAFGRSRTAKGGTGGAVSAIPAVLAAKNLAPFVGDLADRATPIPYVAPNGKTAYGLDAELLPEVCEVYLDARNEGVLFPSQEPAAAAAEILVRGLARVGIVALVDEATGYQVNRERAALQAILDQYIDEALRPWVKKFPDVFFSEMYRIYGWRYDSNNSKRPQYVGKFINKYIYDQLPAGVSEELKRVNPKNEAGNRARKLHQHLTEDTGIPALDHQISMVIGLMRASNSKADFDGLARRAFPRLDPQPPLFVDIDF